MPCWANSSRKRCIWPSRASRTLALGLAKVTWVWSWVMFTRTSRRPSSCGSSWISADFRFWLDNHITRSTTASLQPPCCMATAWPGTRAGARWAWAVCWLMAWLRALRRLASSSSRASALFSPRLSASWLESSPTGSSASSSPSPASSGWSAKAARALAKSWSAVGAVCAARVALCACWAAWAPCSRAIFTAGTSLSWSRSGSRLASVNVAGAALATRGGASRPASTSAGKVSAGSWPAMANSSIGSISGSSLTWVASASSAGKGLPLSATAGWLAAGSAAGGSLLAASSTLAFACLAAASLRSAALAWRSFAYIWAKLAASPLLVSAGFSGAFAAGAFGFTSGLA
ncbi:hypothetical protein D3C85_603070 [compost metagenome]